MGPARAYLRIKRKEIEPLTAPLLLGSSPRFEPGYRCGASLAPQEAGWPCGLWAAPAAELSLGSRSGEAPGLLHPRLPGSSSEQSDVDPCLPGRALRPRGPWHSR